MFRTCLAALIPVVAVAAITTIPGTATVTPTPDGVRITATFRNEMIERDTLPVFDIAAFMTDGAKAMKPGWYRLPGRFSGQTRLAGRPDIPGLSGIEFSVVKVNGPDDAVITWCHPRIFPRSEEKLMKTFSGPNVGYSFAFALKRSADFSTPPATGVFPTVLEKYGKEATLKPTGGSPGTRRSGETRYATFTDTDTLRLSVIKITSECSVVRAVATWKPVDYSVYEGDAKRVGMDFAEAAKMREAALRAYAEKQPEALRKLILTLHDNRASFDVKRFIREADAPLISAIMADRAVITEKSAGVPKAAWQSDNPGRLLSFGAFDVFPQSGRDTRSTETPDADTRRYLKLVASGIPEMNVHAASDTADRILILCRNRKFVLNENGVRLSIERLPEGQTVRGELAAPKGKEHEALILLRDRLLDVIDKS